ncbi:erythronate-4-phosphate dehydrogenase [Pseudomonas flavescens]|uniref:Erythronate-4-phosphate dehydrogenase n=1 Tax=Phytopseudomonas flavescens TaxID=29435 RepID=A0A1G7XFD5_9GAMM|nr:4-phosphoerythronate dehydrogenase PdxB [Pseudomonas flavescens]SDG82919.1 erythronate-4-phosphate dehydrogenase [Pseudomonas flavescens]
MRIVADENIPLLDEFFAGFGEIRRFPGRAIDRAALGDAELLLVRSVTNVDRALLEGSQVCFVGTCTIGTDHLDLQYLAEAGIAWSSAPGCNARGVVDYVLGSLLVLAERLGADLAQRTYGVVGAGQVGERLVRVLRGLGWRVLVCDPPRQRAEGGGFVDLQQIVEQCDVISLHTPLTRDAEFATRHLIDAHCLRRLRPGAWLINASRGAVVDTAALREHLQQGADLHVVLDVWEGEPLVEPALAALCHIATPHIAGYSLDGKLRGTAQIHDAFCRHQGISPQVQLDALTPGRWLPRLSIGAGSEPAWALATLCRAVYDPRRDDADLRRSLVADVQARKAGFDLLRKQYPMRREIQGLEVELRGSDQGLHALITALGARVISTR